MNGFLGKLFFSLVQIMTKQEFGVGGKGEGSAGRMDLGSGDKSAVHKYGFGCIFLVYSICYCLRFFFYIASCMYSG